MSIWVWITRTQCKAAVVTNVHNLSTSRARWKVETGEEPQETQGSASLCSALTVECKRPCPKQGRKQRLTHQAMFFELHEHRMACACMPPLTNVYPYMHIYISYTCSHTSCTQAHHNFKNAHGMWRVYSTKKRTQRMMGFPYHFSDSVCESFLRSLGNLSLLEASLLETRVPIFY